MVVVIEVILVGPDAGAAVVGDEVGSEVADGEETTPPPLGPPDFFLDFPGRLHLNFEHSPILFRKPDGRRDVDGCLQKSLSDEVNVRDFSVAIVRLSNLYRCPTVGRPMLWRPIGTFGGGSILGQVCRF